MARFRIEGDLITIRGLHQVELNAKCLVTCLKQISAISSLRFVYQQLEVTQERNWLLISDPADGNNSRLRAEDTKVIEANFLSTFIWLKIAERSETKSAKRSFLSKYLVDTSYVRHAHLPFICKARKCSFDFPRF